MLTVLFIFRTFLKAAYFLAIIFLVCPVSCFSGVRNYLGRTENWYGTKEAENVAAIVISHQSPSGGWPKNVSTVDDFFAGDIENIRPTFDNGATTDELRFLAKVFHATSNEVFKDSFVLGLDYILSAQYSNGGWPQFHPPGENYHRHITFNDGVMERLMYFIREVSTEDSYLFLDPNIRNNCQRSFLNGLDCILKCQIKSSGKLTVWCAQHDVDTYEPRPGRSYELASLSGSESVGITRLLMSIDNPSEEIQLAVVSAIEWFKISRIPRIGIERVADTGSPKGWNKVVVEDHTSPGLWARFYTLENSRPLFADRDGIPKSYFNEIGYERRNGYSWYGTWPEKLLSTEYPAWCQKWLPHNN